MNSKVETVNVKLEMFKLAGAVAVLLLGIVGFYLIPIASVLLRVLALLACVGVAVIISLQTEQGRAVWAFFSEARTEVRKIVWPSQQESIQTTGWIIVCVIFFAIVMWGLDLVLGWAIRYLIGQGS
ncbi:MAG: preprotein translocase subunit SecE [Gammaproteobacteria bacterium]|nr:preprotein translocase subunit SecE [Gammaproteobacteria bacterium]